MQVRLPSILASPIGIGYTELVPYYAHTDAYQVLIDGDASYFHESFIEAGEKGGERAAAELHAQVKQQVDSIFPGSDLPIMLHMYANLGGLSGLYVRNGVISSPSQLFVFARGFNSSQDMFNLVDVGTGKEGADHKVRGEFEGQPSTYHCPR